MDYIEEFLMSTHHPGKTILSCTNNGYIQRVILLLSPTTEVFEARRGILWPIMRIGITF